MVKTVDDTEKTNQIVQVKISVHKIWLSRQIFCSKNRFFGIINLYCVA